MKVKMLENEHWWGFNSIHAPMQPFDKNTKYNGHLFYDGGNQSAPLLVSDKGRYVYAENAYILHIEDGFLSLEGGEEPVIYDGGKNLRDAFLSASENHFAPTGEVPPLKFFETAQYNTWMEFTYNPTQESVLAYARSIVENGYTPGILIIDEGWHTRYGLWEFDFAKFPDPKGMIDELHKMGFTVMLWVVPIVTADGRGYLGIEGEAKFLKRKWEESPLLKTDKGEVALVRWWNGYSAILNLSLPSAKEYLGEKLHSLMEEYGVDGFKFDGGSLDMYREDNIVNGTQSRYSAIELNKAWNEFGEQFAFHEYKDTYGRGGKSVIQRIRDRGHRWDGDGLSTLIPFALTEGLMGYTFLCPDMIGGGEWSYTELGIPWDEELVVRMAECSALFPMMQFSLAPWRILSDKNARLCLAQAKLHDAFAPRIIEEVKKSAKTGEPILRPLEYNFPCAGFEYTTDMFMLGEDILVAPVLEKGASTRTLTLPEGKWLYRGETEYLGGVEVTVSAPLGTLPYFEKIV